MNKEIIYGIVGAFLGATIMYLAIQNGIFAKTYSNKTEMMANNIASQIDEHFIEQMIPHHEDAITMAKIALTKAEHQEIKTLAQNIIASQSKEIEQMKSWYGEWYGRNLPTGQEVMMDHGMMGKSGMHMGLTGEASDSTRLENAENFDKAFIEGMIPHHQMAVMMAQMLKNGTKRDEMKMLAEDIITAQTKEINEMRQWYKEWGY